MNFNEVIKIVRKKTNVCEQLFYMKLHKELIIPDYHCSSIEFVYSRLTVEIHEIIIYTYTWICVLQ